MSTDTPPSPRGAKPARIKRLQIGVNTLVQLFFLFILLAMANYLSFNHYRRWDYSRTHRYELSEKTMLVLASLKKPVKAIVCFSSNSELYPDVDNLLKEYQYHSNGKVEVEKVDINRNPSRATSLHVKYNFDPKAENIVILDYDGHTKFVRDDEMAIYSKVSGMIGEQPEFVAFKGEQTLTGALLEISDENPHKVYAITGHSEADINGPNLAFTKAYLERENIKLELLNLQDVEAVSADAKTLLIIGPQYDFSEREIKMLRDYWEKKGKLFILLDPNASTPRLAGFLMEQGIKPQDDRVLKVRQTKIAAIAELLPDVEGTFTGKNPVTKNLQGAPGFFIGTTQSLEFDAARAQAADVRLQMLVQANTGYRGESDYHLKDGDPVPDFDPVKDHGQPLPIVASVEKGAPNSNVKVDSARMIIAGNYEFITNKALSPTNANLSFVLNSLDWLLDREELIGIPPKENKSLYFNLTDDQMGHLLMVTVLLMPGAVALFGLALWWKRRH